MGSRFSGWVRFDIDEVRHRVRIHRVRSERGEGSMAACSAETAPTRKPRIWL